VAIARTVDYTWGGCQFEPDQQMNASRWMWSGLASALPGTDPARFSVVLAATSRKERYDEKERPIRGSWFAAGVMETTAGEMRAFIYPDPLTRTLTIRDLGTLGGTSSQANGVNSEGQVVGVSETESGEQHAFLWTESDGMVDLGTLGGELSIAWSINDKGQVVGYTEAYSTTVAFLWTEDEGMVVLWPLEGADGWAAFDINNKGIVVGTSGMEEPVDGLRATMWVLK